MKLCNVKQTNKIKQDKDGQVQSPATSKMTVPEYVWATLQLLWNQLVVCPLVVLFWRGCWNLLEAIISPNLETEFWLLLFIGVIILLDLAKPYMAEWLLNKWFPLRYLGGWLFNTVKAVAMVALWTSTWVDNNKAAQNKPYADFIYQIEGVLPFLVFGFAKSLVQNPFMMVKDSHDTFFHKTRIFKIYTIWHPLMVACFNTGIKQLVAYAWLSCWSLQTIYLLYPTGQTCWDSLLLSVTLAILYLPLHLLLCQLATTTKMKPFIRSIDLAVTAVVFYSSASLWLGVWTLLDQLLPPGPQADLLSVLVSLGTTSLLGMASSLGHDKITWDFRFWDFWGKVFCPPVIKKFTGYRCAPLYYREEEEEMVQEEVSVPLPCLL